MSYEAEINLKKVGIHPCREDLLVRLDAVPWEQRIVPEAALPLCIAHVPIPRRFFCMGSGSMLYSLEVVLDGRRLETVAGLDSFELDPRDEPFGGLVNKTHFWVVRNTLFRHVRAPYVTVGPIKNPSDHWLTDIPETAYRVPLLE